MEQWEENAILLFEVYLFPFILTSSSWHLWNQTCNKRKYFSILIKRFIESDAYLREIDFYKNLIKRNNGSIFYRNFQKACLNIRIQILCLQIIKNTGGYLKIYVRRLSVLHNLSETFIDMSSMKPWNIQISHLSSKFWIN